MISSIFKVWRYKNVGVSNVGTLARVIVDTFEGDIIPKFQQFQDVEQAALITVDNEVTAPRLVNCKINDELMDMASNTFYRVQKIFQYEGPRTIIWVTTSELT